MRVGLGVVWGGFRIDFEWVWVGLELICVRCAAGHQLHLALDLGGSWGGLGLILGEAKG